jgi:heme/copper-type cytochrome/quinol oxidase subunit 2
MWLLFLIFLFKTVLRKYGNSCLGVVLFLFLFILPTGFYAFMIEKGWMLDPATDWVVNIYINLFLIGIGVIAFLTGLVLYFHARKSQDPIRKGRAENVLLFGGTAIIIGLGLLMRSL